MPDGWRARYSQWLVSGGYLLLLGLGAEIDSLSGWALMAAAISVLALMAWMATLRRARSMADTPTSTVASAAQGYVELRGCGRPLGGAPLLAPLTQLPCLWYRYRVERRQRDKWVTEDTGESNASFLLDDGSGECAVDPEGAEVLPARQDRWLQGDRRYTQSLILPGERLYVLGQFQTRGGSDLALDRQADLAHKLNEWKADMPALLARHDLDRDGQFNAQEWERVRQLALDEVESEHRDLRAAPDLHTLRRPEDGRVFMVSTLDPSGIERRLRFWAIAHAACFIAGLAGLGHWWAQR